MLFQFHAKKTHRRNIWEVYEDSLTIKKCQRWFFIYKTGLFISNFIKKDFLTYQIDDENSSKIIEIILYG